MPQPGLEPCRDERQLAVNGNALDHTAIRTGPVRSGQGFKLKGAVANHWHSPHAPDLIIIGKEVREAKRSETVLASPLPMMQFIGRLENSNLLVIVDQILTFGSYLIE